MEPTKFMEAVAMTTESKSKEVTTITMPAYVYEREQTFKERTIRRLIIALIISIILLFATNALWIWHNSQYEFIDSEVTVDTEGEGNANYIGRDGDVYNGKDYGKDESES